MVYLDGGVSV